jgi:peroxiredoxin
LERRQKLSQEPAVASVGDQPHGIAVPAFAAFMADHAHGFDASATLVRGRQLTLPVLESVADVPFDLESHVGDRIAVLFFYAGGWNRADNEALAVLQESMPDFEQLGVAVIAITPELPVHAKATAARNRLSCAVAIDHACRFAKHLGLVVKLPVELRRLIRDSGIRLKSWNGEGSYDLPMPAVVLLDRSRRIRWAGSGAAMSDLDPGDVRAALRSLVATEARARRPLS